jgi:hypothetical protein
VEGYNEAAVALRKLAAAQKEALPDVVAAREAARASNEITKARVSEWNSLWSTVESTGKQVFVHLLSGGKGAFEAIGKAIKASVIDLLYQLTVKKWIIQIGTSFAGSMGIPALGAAAGGGAGGGVLSSMGSSFAGSSMGQALGFGGGAAASGAIAAGSEWMTVAGGAALADGSLAGMGAAASGGTGALAAMGPWGWAALAGLAIVGSGHGKDIPIIGGMFGGEEKPWGGRDPSLSLRANHAGLPFHLGEDNFGDVSVTNDPRFWQFTKDLIDPTKYDQDKIAAMGDFSVRAPNGTPMSALLDQMMQRVAPANIEQATAMKAQQEAADAAAKLARETQIATARRQIDIQLLQAQGRAEEALAEIRKDELAGVADELKPLVQQLWATQDAAKVAAEQAEVATRQREEEAAAAATLATGMAQAREAIRSAQDPIGYWTSQVFAIGAGLGTSVSSVEGWRTAFLAAMDGPLSQAQFDKWQSLGDAIQRATDAAAALVPSADMFATLFEFTRAQRLSRTGQWGGVPGFAGGGDHAGGARIVGEFGPEIEITGPSRILSNSQSRGFFDVSGLVSQMQAMNQRLEAIAMHTYNTAKRLDDWDGENGIKVDSAADNPVHVDQVV